MQLFDSIILGLIQGLTEFLPVSSSGHLVISQHLLGFCEPEILFDISVHVGTLAAIFFYFASDIRRLVVHGCKLSVYAVTNRAAFLCHLKKWETRMILMILVASVPTAIIGLLLEQVAETLFASTTLAGAMLLVTGCVLWATRYVLPSLSGDNAAGTESSSDTKTMTYGKAVAVGIAQGLAVLPGISRSGATISTALFLKTAPAHAVRFSFLLSIPAILGAHLLKFDAYFESAAIPWHLHATGAVVACLSGCAALAVLMRVVKKGRLYIFAPYCWLVGIAVILLLR